jgi:hypothetical protein
MSRLDPRRWTALAWAQLSYGLVGIPALIFLDARWRTLVIFSAALGLLGFEAWWRKRNGLPRPEPKDGRLRRRLSNSVWGFGDREGD